MSFPTVLSPACSQRCGDLAFGRGNANARTGDKLSNSHKTFREQTPRLTPNRLLAVRVSLKYYQINEISRLFKFSRYDSCVFPIKKLFVFLNQSPKHITPFNSVL